MQISKAAFENVTEFEPDLTDNMVIAIFSDGMRETDERAGASNPATASQHAYMRWGNSAWTEAPIIRSCAKQ